MFIERPVFPSKKRTILVAKVANNDLEAHEYRFQNSKGFENGEALYDNTYQTIRFVQKVAGQRTIPGLQSEQLVIALIDRHKKLNDKFPCSQNEKMIKGLEMFLEACQERVEERIEAGVMGQHKNVPASEPKETKKEASSSEAKVSSTKSKESTKPTTTTKVEKSSSTKESSTKKPVAKKTPSKSSVKKTSSSTPKSKKK